MNRQFVCPVLIGRDDQRTALLQWLRAGRPAVAVVSGEAGVGKSRLIEEAVAAAQASREPLIVGRCFEPDAGFPFAPFVDAIERLNLTSVTLPPDIAAAIAPLARLVPALAATVPRDELTGDPDEDRRRLNLALAHLIRWLSRDNPALLVLEDLHWADQASLDAILVLARRGAGVRILLSHRADEVGPGLLHLLSELDRDHLSLQLDLPRLNAEQARDLIRETLAISSTQAQAFASRLFPLSGGNPFFLEELLKSLAMTGRLGHPSSLEEWLSDGVIVPTTVRDAVARRMGYLTPGDVRVLTIAAVAGQQCDFELLRSVSGLDERALLGHLRQLIDAQLLVESRPDEFAFRHALAREAIYQSLLSRERRSLHLELAVATETLYGREIERHVEALAEHYYRCESWEKALRFSRLAGEKSQRLFSPHAAVSHFTRALTAAEHLAGGGDAALFRSRGEAREHIGDHQGARDDYAASLERARSAGDRAAEWQALIDLGFLALGEGYGEAAPHLEAALALARDIGDPALVARSLNRFGNLRLNVGDYEESLAAHRQALEIFESQGDLHGQAETLDLLGMASALAGQVQDSGDYYGRAIPLLEQLGETRWLCSALSTRPAGGPHFIWEYAGIPLRPGAMPPPSYQRAISLCREINWPAGEAYGLAQIAWALGSSGNYAEAFAYLDRGLAVTDEIGHKQWKLALLIASGAIHLDLLTLDVATEYISRALDLARETGSTHWIQTIAPFIVQALAEQGSLDEARSVLDEARSLGFEPLTLDGRYLRVAAAILALHSGDAQSSLQEVRSLLRDNAEAQGTAPRLRLLEARALHGLGDLPSALGSADAALAEAQTLGSAPLTWRADAEAAALLARLDNPRESERRFSRARTEIDRLAELISDSGLRERFLQAGTAAFPRAFRHSARYEQRRELAGLTPREMEIAVLIAEGAANKDIAARLVVSERTVTTHVTNILSKLGFTTRSQVVAWVASRRGEDEPAPKST